MEKNIQILINLFNNLKNCYPDNIEALSGAGSNRRYYRLSTSRPMNPDYSLIGVIGEERKENHAFIALSRQMRSKGLHVPEVLAVSDDEMCYLQSDLGSTSLYDHIAACQKSGHWDEITTNLLKTVMRDLPQLQFKTADGFDFEHDTARLPRFDRTGIMWDLNYFKYCFLKPCGVNIDEVALERDFEQLANALLSLASSTVKTFLYRDFQSRNVMICDGKPYYIDFQGGFEGPVYYDVASFLWQARAAYPESLREELLHEYHAALNEYQEIPYEDFKNNLMLFVFFRLIQVLGAYGFRGLFERKAMFLSPIKQALSLISQMPEECYSLCPTLKSILSEVIHLPKFQESTSNGLVVRVTSFSFKKGIPDDPSGNGGGFIFDCRAPHNPGRYKEYKKLTGLQQPVIDFLEGRIHDYDDEKLGTELTMPEYMEHVYGVVDPAVETYLKRGFTSLMVSFGCTGGQHRSVYGAQHLAEHLHKKYPDATIELWHREQGIRETLHGL